MTPAYCVWILMFGLLGATNSAKAADDSSGKSSRLLVHLLDYLAKDYAGAVDQNGQVLSESEYNEQVEFSESALSTSRGLPELDAQPQIRNDVEKLKGLIAAKAAPAAVAKLARDLQKQVIEVTHLEVSPSRWPNLVSAKTQFHTQCASCHGDQGRGDGPAGVALEPKPTNFYDAVMMELTPIGAFNTIRLGVPGTGMPPFPALSDDEVWGLAFFAVSLRYGEPLRSAEEANFSADRLKLAATNSDATLKEQMSETDLNTLRRHSASESSQNSSLALVSPLLAEAFQAYESGNHDLAKTKALKAYLEGIEPVEPRVRATDPTIVAVIEAKMSAVRAAIEAGQPNEQVAAAIAAANAEVHDLQDLLTHKDLSPSVAFTASSIILLREGFEAVLLILALLGVIRSSGSREAALAVHGGWMAAVGLGIVTWFFSGYLLDMSGASREMMEGLTSLFAVAVLLVVGFWLHSRTEIGRWNHFLKVKVRRSVEGRNLLGLAFIAFIAVFREAFEVVLFLRAIYIEAGSSARMAMLAGVVGTFILLILGTAAVLRFSARLPVRKLFLASAAVMAVLAFILTGKGLHSLQETGLLGVTSTPIPMRSDLFGIYPTWQTLAPQILVLGLIMLLWTYGRRPSGAAAAK